MPRTQFQITIRIPLTLTSPDFQTAMPPKRIRYTMTQTDRSFQFRTFVTPTDYS
jgi:hypothetical protein